MDQRNSEIVACVACGEDVQAGVGIKLNAWTDSYEHPSCRVKRINVAKIKQRENAVTGKILWDIVHKFPKEWELLTLYAGRDTYRQTATFSVGDIEYTVELTKIEQEQV